MRDVHIQISGNEEAKRVALAWVLRNAVCLAACVDLAYELAIQRKVDGAHWMVMVMVYNSAKIIDAPAGKLTTNWAPGSVARPHTAPRALGSRAPSMQPARQLQQGTAP